MHPILRELHLAVIKERLFLDTNNSQVIIHQLINPQKLIKHSVIISYLHLTIY